MHHDINVQDRIKMEKVCIACRTVLLIALEPRRGGALYSDKLGRTDLWFYSSRSIRCPRFDMYLLTTIEFLWVMDCVARGVQTGSHDKVCTAANHHRRVSL